VWQCAAVCGSVHGSVRAVPQCTSVCGNALGSVAARQYVRGSAAVRLCAAVCTAVYGIVWQCVRQCVAVRVVSCEQCAQ
jgi:hypothetical protein